MSDKPKCYAEKCQAAPTHGLKFNLYMSNAEKPVAVDTEHLACAVHADTISAQEILCEKKQREALEKEHNNDDQFISWSRTHARWVKIPEPESEES